MDKKDFGFVYVATGKKYIDEVMYSCVSLRKHHPDVPICLMTDMVEEVKKLNHPFNDILEVKNPTHSLLDKLEIKNTPYERSIFIDTDTICIEPITELFDLLTKCDLIVHQNAEGYDYDYTQYGLNVAMPEFNTGVLGFVKSRMDELSFFEQWRELYLKYQHTKLTDQLSFRILVYNSKVRYCWIPAAYNFFIYFPAYTSIHAKIIHGRPFSHLENVARKINQTKDFRGSWQRCYFPELDEVVHDKLSLKASVALTKRIVPLIIKNIYRKIRY